MDDTTPREPRDRLLETAGELFYRDGYHAVGVDTIVARSGVSKMTLYRHFPSKDHLIAAFLEQADRDFRSWLETAIAGQHDPEARLVVAFDAIARLATSPRCLGCAFQMVAAEFPDREHPGHRIALAHKQWMLGHLADMTREAGLRDPIGLAAQLLLLMDGAWVAARVFGPGSQAGTVAAAARTLIDAHRTPARV